MKMRIGLCVLAACFAAAAASAQTATPTPTPTSTPTFTPTSTPTFVSARFVAPHSLIVPSGGTTSNQVELNPNMRFNLTILVPATIDGTVTLEIADVNGGTFKTYQNPAGTDLALAAGKAVPTGEFSAAQMRIKEGTTAAAQRVFIVMGSGQ